MPRSADRITKPRAAQHSSTPACFLPFAFYFNSFVICFYQYFSSPLAPCFPFPPTSCTTEGNLQCSICTLCTFGQFAVGQFFSIAFFFLFLLPPKSPFLPFPSVPPLSQLQVCHRRKALSPHPAPVVPQGFIFLSAQRSIPNPSVRCWCLCVFLLILCCCCCSIRVVFFGMEPCARGEGRRAAARAFK